ncbi:MAG: response regulator transcription factor [Porphyromonadaceae bacterium]|nr:response regulator transcription factor [Porphyromonadaceae bacterium]
MRDLILVVDDDASIVEIIEFNLKHEGYEVLTAASAELALPLVEQHPIRLILLDVMMGGMSGYKLAETLRQRGYEVPIIFLTARSSENDMLTGFSVGADDYISKPFSLKELLARTEAVLRRSQRPKQSEEASSRLTYSGLEIDLEAREVYSDGVLLQLTKTETELLLYLVSHPDRIFSRSDLIDSVWRETPFITERTVDVHIARLRKKLGAYYATTLVNRPGYGYKFMPSMLLCD